MENSQPRTRLLSDSPLLSPSRHPPNVHGIPRKPLPKANASYTSVAKEARDDEDGTPTPSLQPLSTATSHQHYSKASRTFGRQQKPRRSMPGRLRHITLVCLFLVLPLLGVTTALLAIVYQNRLPNSPLESSQPCSGLVVDYGASQLTSLSTWVSTIATLLAPAFMALLSYPVAKSMTRRLATEDSVKNLPSPYQTGLLVELLGGGLVALWQSLSYMMSRKRAQIPPILYLSYAALVLGVLFGVLTQLADFWLHRATNSILYTISRPASCTGIVINATELNPPCSVVCGEYDFYPTGFDQGFLLANSLSTTSSLTVTNVSVEISPDGPRTVVALLPAEVPLNITWTAQTVGVSAHCEYLFDKCQTQNDPAGDRFLCGPEVPPVGYNSSGPIPFNDSETSSTFSQIIATLQTSPSDASRSNVLNNPWTFGLAMRMTAVVRGYEIPDNLPTGDNTIFSLVMCNATTYDIEYSVGDQARNTTSSTTSNPITIRKMERSNANVHDTVQGHILRADVTSDEYLGRAMLASIFSARGSGDVLPRFEEEYGRVALSFASPSFEKVPTTQRNVVEERVVSCVQRAPLWSLVGLVGVYIVLAIALAITAVVVSPGQNVRSAQSQLSVAGLAAKAFDERGLKVQQWEVMEMEDLLEERNLARYKESVGCMERSDVAKRVGFKVNEAGRWEYDVVPGQMDPSSDNNRL